MYVYRTDEKNKEVIYRIHDGNCQVDVELIDVLKDDEMGKLLRKTMKKH